MNNAYYKDWHTNLSSGDAWKLAKVDFAYQDQTLFIYLYREGYVKKNFEINLDEKTAHELQKLLSEVFE